MSPTLVRILLTVLLCVVLAMAVFVMRFHLVGSLIAGAIFVVLVLGLWMVRSVGRDLAQQATRANPQDLIADTRAFIKAVLKDFDEKEVESIRSDAQDLILVTLEQVEKGQIKNAKKAAETLKSVPAKGLGKLKNTGVISSSLARFYLLADTFQDSDEADDTKNLIDNFIAGIHDADLMK